MRKRVAVISMANPNIYPAMHHISEALVQEGVSLRFLSVIEPTREKVIGGEFESYKIPLAQGISKIIPIFRSNYHRILFDIYKYRPNIIIAQHEYLLPSILYKMKEKDLMLVGYFSDYYRDIWHHRLIGNLSHFLDAYVDICDMRLQWRKKDWPKMRADTFIIRQAPFRRRDERLEGHQGPTRVIFTGSRFVLGLNADRLSRFLARLCEKGISVDWYLPGPDEARATARSLVSHALFAVRDPVEKLRLMETLGQYDVGLHWAPMVEQDYDPDYFMSAASNKIGEYIAAGLVVAHAGNPGLAYLPDDVCAVFDPTDPEAGADQLAAQLSDRATIERKRQAALRYHLDEMNFEAQATSFLNFIMNCNPSSAGTDR